MDRRQQAFLNVVGAAGSTNPIARVPQNTPRPGNSTQATNGSSYGDTNGAASGGVLDQSGDHYWYECQVVPGSYGGNRVTFRARNREQAHIENTEVTDSNQEAELRGQLGRYWSDDLRVSLYINFPSEQGTWPRVPPEWIRGIRLAPT